MTNIFMQQQQQQHSKSQKTDYLCTRTNITPLNHSDILFGKFVKTTNLRNVDRSSLSYIILGSCTLCLFKFPVHIILQHIKNSCRLFYICYVSVFHEKQTEYRSLLMKIFVYIYRQVVKN